MTGYFLVHWAGHPDVIGDVGNEALSVPVKKVELAENGGDPSAATAFEEFATLEAEWEFDGVEFFETI
jgi:hypothetical protein